MKLKKYLLLAIVVIIYTSITLFLGFKLNATNKEESFDDTSKSKQVVRESTLSMMIEQTAGAGDYKMETRTSWPTDGYVFNEELSKCENGGELGWDDTNKAVTMTGNMSDKCYVYFDIYVSPTLAEYVISQYTGIQGENNIYHHDGSLTNGINDGSYRYAGASDSVNNYVCISDEETCSDANLFRIIGVFDEGVKLIKATSIGSYAWGTYFGPDGGSTSTNVWAKGYLNGYLNGDYLTSLGDFATNYIATTTWKVGGNTSVKIKNVVPATTYANEITSPAESTTVDAKIGLMYVSDYGFAAGSTAWSTMLGDDGYAAYASAINWLHLGSNEWLITPIEEDFSEYAFSVISYGKVISSYTAEELAARPVFYLESSVTYSSGTGSSTDPIRIN